MREPGKGSTRLRRSRLPRAAFSWRKSKSFEIPALLRCGELRLPVHRDIPWLVRDAREPSSNRRKPAEIKIRLVGDMSVSVQRDIGDREMVCDEKPMPSQMAFHDTECAIAVFHPVFERMALQFAAALDQREPEVGCADVWLQAVLYEEHPLQCFSSGDSIFWRQRRAAGDIPKNCIRLCEVTLGSDLK